MRFSSSFLPYRCTYVKIWGLKLIFDLANVFFINFLLCFVLSQKIFCFINIFFF
ncbi:unnamed protein product [Meloidogyne enterolobii]|uniref:Uncharacterized protein n=1 Tax=Meloidogyne enterolobii TaxID=390850 RepID=A0ACB0YZ38_MELEN